MGAWLVFVVWHTQNNSKNCGPDKGNVACQFVVMDPAAVAPPIVGQTVVQVRRAELHSTLMNIASSLLRECSRACVCGRDGCGAGEPSRVRVRARE